MPPTTKTKATEDEYAPTAWGQQQAVGYAEDIIVPSGQKARVRRPGLKGLVAAGVLDHMDSLTKIVGEKHIKRAKGGALQKIDVEAIAKDPKKIVEMVDVMDKIVEHVVLRPIVHKTPPCDVCKNDYSWHDYAPPGEVDHEPDLPLEEGKVYTHQIDDDDKMYIINFAVGGTRDLESFRKQREELVDSVESQ